MCKADSQKKSTKKTESAVAEIPLKAMLRLLNIYFIVHKMVMLFSSNLKRFADQDQRLKQQQPQHSHNYTQENFKKLVL